MTRISEYLLRTTRETPADAELVSHQLMLRSGMVRKVASGILYLAAVGLSCAASCRASRA